MEEKDERLEPLRTFTARSLRLQPDRWRQLVSADDTQVTLSCFLSSQDVRHLFVWLQPRRGLCVSLDLPHGVETKVICASKAGREGITKENSRGLLLLQEVQGGDLMSFIGTVTEQVTCPLLSNPKTSTSWATGVAEEALGLVERMKNEARTMKARIDGQTFLPHPAVVHDDGSHDDVFDGVHDNTERQASDMKLLHACEATVIEWAELVSEVLQQDSSEPVLDGLKPLPSHEFDFWRNRLRNLLLIQEQLRSSRAQQVASIVQRADSIYWSTLRDVHRDVQEGLQEAEDVTLSLSPLQQKLEDLQQVDYQQLGAKMAAVMEEVLLVWIRSESYCKPCRVVVLLQEICNLCIQLSRDFLRGEAVMRGLVSDPGPVLGDIKLVIWTLQTLKEAYSQCRTQLEQQQQNQSWDFPPHLVFLHVDNFLTCLHSIQELLQVRVQLHQLGQTILSGVCGRMWTDVVQDVYQDFLRHVTALSESSCDPTDPEDQSFKQDLDEFLVRVSDLELRLVSVLSAALEDCSVVSSAAKLVDMFGFVLDRPLIRGQLCPHLMRLLEMVLEELDQTEQLFYSQRKKPETFSRFSPAAAAGLCWTRQLRLRAEDALRNFRTVQHLYLDSGESQLVLQRFLQVLELLQDFRDCQRSDWSHQLDSDCGFILEQPVILQGQLGMLGVNCSHKLEAVLRELRYVSRETGVELGPHAARLFACRDDITQTYLSLGHMVSCLNQVKTSVLQVEGPLIQDQLEDLNQTLSELQRSTWISEGVQQLVQQQRDRVLMFHRSVSEARANIEAMNCIVQGAHLVWRPLQGWAELPLLQRSGESLLGGGAPEQSYRRIREEGQQLLHLTQVNRSLYGAEDSSESWIRYLDHIDDKVQDGLFQLLLTSLRFLCDSTNPQRCSAALVAVRLLLQETGSVFEPSVGVGLSDLLQAAIADVYTAASLPPRISAGRHSNYQVSVQQHPELLALEQEVMRHLLQVREEAEHLRAGLDRYSYLWQSNRMEVMQEFLTYSRQLGPEELEAEEAPPTLKDFKREIESLNRQSKEVSHLDDVTALHGWLQVDLQPFRDSLLSVVCDWKHLYTEYLLDWVTHSLQQVTQQGDDDENEASSSSRFPLTETILLLEAAGVQLPEHLSAQLQC